MGEIKFGLAPTTNYTLIHGFEKDLASEGERLGYYSLYTTDHLAGQLECWTRLSVLAMVSNKIRLGTLVLCNSMRNPALVANMAATLDIISNGRLDLGIGAGYQTIDYETCGIPLMKPSIRIAQLEESIEIIKKMWTEYRPTYRGQYYWIKEARCPTPVQTPHPPIMIGGTGEKLTLRLVARHADLCNFSMTSVEQSRHKLEVLNKHCNAEGRDFDTIEKSWYGYMLTASTSHELMKDIDRMRKSVSPDTATYNMLSNLDFFKTTNIIGTAEECIMRVQEYLDAGITYFVLGFIDKKHIRLFAEEVIPSYY